MGVPPPPPRCISFRKMARSVFWTGSEYEIMRNFIVYISTCDWLISKCLKFFSGWPRFVKSHCNNCFRLKSFPGSLKFRWRNRSQTYLVIAPCSPKLAMSCHQSRNSNRSILVSRFEQLASILDHIELYPLQNIPSLLRKKLHSSSHQHRTKLAWQVIRPPLSVSFQFTSDIPRPDECCTTIWCATM